MVANFFTLMKVLGYLGVPKNAWAFSNFKKSSPNEPSTEQASESVHSDFEQFWEQGFKRQLGSPDYQLKALQCISTYAARHI